MAKSQDNSGMALIMTLLILIVYYTSLKPVLTLDILGDYEAYIKHTTTGMIMITVLLFSLTTVNTMINLYGFQSKCGGALGDNLYTVFMSSFLPWFFIFGAVCMVLIVFPGFKSAFSNVFGYYAVSKTSDDILNTLLGNPNTDDAINDPEISAEDKDKLRGAADAILKITGNTSILINQITPNNFNNMWNLLLPLMKPQYQAFEAHVGMKERLLEMAILRDNIGEFFWFFYTSILLIIMVKAQLVSAECKMSLEELRAKQGAYANRQDRLNAVSNKDKDAIAKARGKSAQRDQAAEMKSDMDSAGGGLI